MGLWGTSETGLERIGDLIPKLPLFDGVPPGQLRRFFNEFEWFSLPGGRTLMERGDPGDSLYIVTAGSLGMLLPDSTGEDYMAGQFVPGQTVGEMGLLSGESRPATLIALRDTEILQITKDSFHKIVDRHPVVMENLARVLAQRLRASIRGRHNEAQRSIVPKTIAIIPVSTGVPCRAMGEWLVNSLIAHNCKAMLLDTRCGEQSSEWLHTIEADHDHIIYLSDGKPEAWSRLCLRQADRVLLVARADADGTALSPMAELVLQGPRRFVELVLIHPQTARYAQGADLWLKRFRPDFHHNLRENDITGFGRLARHLMGQAIGLVMAGGGARGFAHLGVLRALREARLPIDMIGGTSIGGIIGAGVASGWPVDELQERIHKSFVATNPLSDYALPLTGFVKGRKISRLLREHFGERRIEDLWLNYFCVSANLTRGRQAIHRDGVIWRSLRASVAIPGVIAPVVCDGDVLVDGAVMNNFPVTLMAERGRGPVIGVDVEDHNAFGANKNPEWREKGWGILGVDVRGGPRIVSLLMRAGTVNSEMQTNQARARADLLFDPPLDAIGVGDWKLFDQVVERGYKHAVEVLEKTDLSPFLKW